MTEWDDLVDCLLSTDVFRAAVKAPDGSFTDRPSWSILLDFEYPVWKWICRKVNGCTRALPEALRTARQAYVLLRFP